MKVLRPNTLLCFSPPVMAATIIIELGLALWVAIRYTTSNTRRLIIALLVFLAGFQIAELNVCDRMPPDLLWSRIGYVFITLLPPLSLHLVTLLRRKPHAPLVRIAYITGALFATAFAILPAGLNQGICTGNYVIFRLEQPLALLYMIYYFGLVFLGLIMALLPLKRVPARNYQATRWLAIGYLTFTMPTFILNILLPSTVHGIPSIMCGFAVLFAIILGLRVASFSEKARKRKS